MTKLDTQDYSLGLECEEALQSSVDRGEQYIYTSIRYDPIFKDSPENTAASFNIQCPFYMLEHHWTRLQVANWSAQFWSDGPPKTHGRPADFLYGLIYAVRQWQAAHPKEAEWAESLRIRRRSYASGRVTTEIWQIPRKPLSDFFPTSLDVPEPRPKSEWTIYLDNQPTVATEATMFKIWDRSPQSRARLDAGILNLGSTREVILYDSERKAIDGSNSTVYFLRKGRWVTPSSAAGGLQGTTRRWALEKGMAIEAAVSIDSLVDGEIVWLSNGVRGFFWGVFRAERPALRESSSAERQRMFKQLS